MKRPQRRLAALAPLLAALAACGGGGNGDSGTPANAGGSSAATVQGVYQGSMTGTVDNNVFQLLALEDGTYWVLYGTASGEGFSVNGFLQGSGASGTGTFTSPDARDFGFSPSVQASVRASFSSSAVSGTLSESNVSGSFSGNLTSDPSYQYDTPAASAVTGDWTLSLLDGTTASVSVAATGAFSASNEGCAISGTISPRASGKNVFDVAIRFGAAPCQLPGGTASGIAMVATQGPTSELTILAVDSTRTYGLAADGTR